MAGWPSIDRAGDLRLAQAFRAGDISALAPIYDTYGPRLFDYCHVLLRDEETAAQAVQDVMIIACERVAALPDPRLFRGWLYAVTRAECQRRRAYAEIPAERQKAAEAGALVEIDESTRRLVHEALLVLTGQQRELLDLALRHELDPHELAEVMFITPQEASALVQQARGDLDDAFAAVVVSATGLDDCPSVANLAGPPGAPLDVDTCRTLARHIGNCPICGLRANGKVATARLLHAMPIAAVPAGLRARVLTAATDPRYAELRATIAMRADPAPDDAVAATATMPAASHRESERRRGSRAAVVLCGAAFGAILVFGGVFVMLPGADGGQHNTGNQAIAATPSDSASADPSQPSVSPSDPKASRTPTPTPTPSPSKTPKPKHSSKSPAPHNPAPPQPPAPGSLSVSGCHMNGSYSCQISIMAVGGPVNWSVTGASDPLDASGSGSLSSGESTSVTVHRQGFCIGSGSGEVSFSPNGSAHVSWFC